jgi:hypothetical protein
MCHAKEFKAVADQGLLMGGGIFAHKSLHVIVKIRLAYEVMIAWNNFFT